jgi:hypothetical protein
MQETSGCEWGAQLSYRTSVVVKCDSRCPSLLTDYLTSHGVLRIVADGAKHTRAERSIRGAVQRVRVGTEAGPLSCTSGSSTLADCCH